MWSRMRQRLEPEMVAATCSRTVPAVTLDSALAMTRPASGKDDTTPPRLTVAEQLTLN